jgi:hypothetical protein
MRPGYLIYVTRTRPDIPHGDGDVFHTKLSTPKFIPFDQETVSWQRESYEMNKRITNPLLPRSDGMYKEKLASDRSPCILHSTGGYGRESYNRVRSLWYTTPSQHEIYLPSTCLYVPLKTFTSYTHMLVLFDYLSFSSYLQFHLT